MLATSDGKIWGHETITTPPCMAPEWEVSAGIGRSASDGAHPCASNMLDFIWCVYAIPTGQQGMNLHRTSQNYHVYDMA